MKFVFLIILNVLVFCMGCTERKKTELAFYENEELADNVEDDESENTSNAVSYNANDTDNNEVCIPFTEEGGVKLIDVTVN